MTLTVSEQLRILGKIWGNRSGFVFLPWIAGTARTVEARRENYHEGPGYKWPVEKDKIRTFLRQHDTDDVYFTPCLFEEDRRIEQYALNEHSLWADLDEADPRSIEESWVPTLAWESSPGRYQGIWLLEESVQGLSWAGRENQRLTVMLGADPSGWDTTQLLRVPGRMNHKPMYDKPQPGAMLWDDGPVYPVSQLEQLPEITALVTGEDIDFVDEQAVSAVDRHAVWGRVRLKVSSRVREFMAVRGKPGDIERGEGVDRSNIAWEICRELADAGCPVVEIVALLRASVWNTYAGRNDELKRLKMQAAKAIVDRDGASSVETDFEEIVRSAPESMLSLLLGDRQRPEWLVRNVWAKGAVGFISGQPKSYKSWVALDLAISTASGEDFLGDPQFSINGDDGWPVLYVQEEDSETTVLDRATSVIMGRNAQIHPHGWVDVTGGGVVWCPPVHDRLGQLHVYARRGFKVSDPGWQSWLDETLGDLSVRLLVIDTLGTTAGVVDIDKSGDLNEKILGPLKTLAEKHGCAIAVVHHNNKAEDNKRAGQKMLGSTALHAWVDNALYISAKERRGLQWSVSVERESKAAADTRFKVLIPNMGVQFTHDGVGKNAEAGFREEVTTWWNPTVQTIMEDDDAGTNTVIASPEERRATRRGDRPPAGTKLTSRLRNAGAAQHRPHNVERIMQANEWTRSVARKRIADALRNGLIQGDETTGYWPVGEG